ncbi:type IV pilus modification PilV family protein [Acidithiobacillus caldus]
MPTHKGRKPSESGESLLGVMIALAIFSIASVGVLFGVLFLEKHDIAALTQFEAIQNLSQCLYNNGQQDPALPTATVQFSGPVAQTQSVNVTTYSSNGETIFNAYP